MLVRLLLVACTLLLAVPTHAENTAFKTLVVGSEQDYPPFALGKTDDTADGFTVDLWKVIAHEAGLNYTLRVLPFHQLLQDFKDGKIDVLINLAQSKERHKFADFTVPHVTVHGAVFIRKDTRDIRSEQDLATKSIIVVSADIGHEYAIGQGWQSQLTLVPTAAEGLLLLASGKHDAMFVSKLVGMRTLEILKLPGITALPVTAGATQKFSFAVQKGNADLLALLNEGMALSKSSGAYDKLFQKWFSVYEEKEPNPADMLKYLLPLVAGFLVYVGISYFRQRKAMQQLAESHHMLQTVIETIPMRVFWKDRDSRYLGCNTLFARDGGVQSPAEVIGKLDTDFPWREEAELYRADDLAVTNSGQPKLAYDEPQTTPHGHQVWVRTSKTPLRDLHQNVFGMLGVYEDISAIKKIEQALLESEAQLKSLFDNMTNGFALHEVIRDNNGKVVDYRFLAINAAFERLTGLGSEQTLGKTVREVTPGVEEYWIDNFALVVDTGESRHLENYSSCIGRWFSSYAYRTAPERFAVIVEDITERKHAAEALAESENRLSEILENVSAYIYLKDVQGRYLFANKLVRELWNASMADIIGAGDEKFFDAETAANIRKNDRRVLVDGETIRAEESNTVIKTGVTSTYWSVKLPLRRENGEIYALCGISTDISEVKQAQEQLLLASMVYENSSESMMVTDAEGNIIAINPAFTRTTGYSLAEVLGKNPRILSSGRHDAQFFQELWHAINTTGSWQGEVWDRRKNGEIYPKWLTINTTFNADGTPHRRVALFSDITDKKNSEKLIWRQANYDALTGLPNRRMFHDRLLQEIKKAGRNENRLALLFIDLDGFKEVNDTLGHSRGDVLLTEVALRLQGCVRESDTVARLGGDEFTIIVSDLDDIHSIDRIAQCILASMAEPFSLVEGMTHVSASIGISIFPEHGSVMDILLKNADRAMYAAKQQGRNRYNYFGRE
jgi:diguanylate cyclase (GGDEF)-like protein/PAS domain S-box-containing protein